MYVFDVFDICLCVVGFVRVCVFVCFHFCLHFVFCWLFAVPIKIAHPSVGSKSPNRDQSQSPNLV